MYNKKLTSTIDEIQVTTQDDFLKNADKQLKKTTKSFRPMQSINSILPDCDSFVSKGFEIP